MNWNVWNDLTMRKNVVAMIIRMITILKLIK